MPAQRRSSARDVTVIADGGGGITLQITDKLGRRFQHDYYGRGQAVQLATDLKAAFRIPADCEIDTPLGRGMIAEYRGVKHVGMWTHAAMLDNGAALCLPEWEGNELVENGWCEPTHDQQRNGAYRVYDGAEVLLLDRDEAWGAGMQELVDALGAMAHA